MDQYIGEIRMFGGNFPPQGWELCNGQLLPISQYDVLFSLLGTTYGGDGQTTFALPNLMGRLPLHRGRNPQTGTTYIQGQAAGTETVTLTTQNLPAHTHQAAAFSENGNASGPAGAVWAGSGLNQFSNTAPNAAMNAQSVQPAGGSQPHDNMMPFLAYTFIIATEGLYPQQA